MEGIGLVLSLLLAGSLQAFPLSSQANCGQRNSGGNLYIAGGLRAIEGEFPWQVSIQVYSSDVAPERWVHICGGSILNDRWIVTAAHCIEFDPKYDRVRIVAGSNRLSGYAAATQSAFVKDAIVHPEYTIRGVQNDIGLLEVGEPLKLNSSSVFPLCLPSELDEETFESLECVATGWGRTSADGEMSDDLLKVDLSVLNNEECKSAYKHVLSHGLATFHTKICAGRRGSDGYGVCQGDSGGPLACRPFSDKQGIFLEDGYFLAGVSSFSRGCGQARYPDVFTRVSVYLNWIHSISGLTA